MNTKSERDTSSVANLSESEERFRLLVEGTRDYAIFMLDPQGRIASWNSGAQRIKGYSHEEIIGQHFSVFYPLEDRLARKPDRELEIALATGKYEEEGWRVRKDGTLFWASVVITALRNEHHELRGFGKVTRDLTERRRLEQSLIEKNTALEKALLGRDRFLASMSHELRTPLNAILGYTGTLLMKLPGPLNAEQEKQLRTIQSSGKHLLSLINDLLSVAKLIAGKVETRRDEIPVRTLVEEVVTTLRPFADQKGINLSAGEIAEDLVLISDRRTIGQILLNLVTNACKFTDRGSVRIEVEGDATGTRPLKFHVIDTGIGISATDLSRLFQPFVRLTRDDAGDGQGIGLGLHLSQGLAELLGGRITVQSEPGRGSRFTLTLER